MGNRQKLCNIIGPKNLWYYIFKKLIRSQYLESQFL